MMARRRPRPASPEREVTALAPVKEPAVRPEAAAGRVIAVERAARHRKPARRPPAARKKAEPEARRALRIRAALARAAEVAPDPPEASPGCGPREAAGAALHSTTARWTRRRAPAATPPAKPAATARRAACASSSRPRSAAFSGVA